GWGGCWGGRAWGFGRDRRRRVAPSPRCRRHVPAARRAQDQSQRREASETDVCAWRYFLLPWLANGARFYPSIQRWKPRAIPAAPAARGCLQLFGREGGNGLVPPHNQRHDARQSIAHG